MDALQTHVKKLQDQDLTSFKKTPAWHLQPALAITPPTNQNRKFVSGHVNPNLHTFTASKAGVRPQRSVQQQKLVLNFLI